MSTTSYTEFGFRFNNRKFAVKIPKLKIRTPKMLMRRKCKNIPATKSEGPDIGNLNELSLHYNSLLTVSRESTRRASAESSDSLRSSIMSAEQQRRNTFPAAHDGKPFVEVSDTIVSIEDSYNFRNSSPYSNHYENMHLSSTPVSFSLDSEYFRGERRVIVLQDVSGVKIYEDIEQEEFASILEDTTGATVYEEIDNSARVETVCDYLDRTYENIETLLCYKNMEFCLNQERIDNPSSILL